MEICRFVKEKAEWAHGNTILSGPVFPADLPVPFGHAWGYCEEGMAIEPHDHPSIEIYQIFSGEGIMTIDGEDAPVRPGDNVVIPPNATHTIRPVGGPILWAAFWWMERDVVK